ncbi:oxidized purine nucleoside triphosphate hydrolase-like isoform X2 [Ptychodera flava]|uniref:oxidized purine nucleoside triphosphate hydrolase-like isoform X2 n=1 Tax=Ptychodera flava TaxID=63121 RepID=UPI003969C08D
MDDAVKISSNEILEMSGGRFTKKILTLVFVTRENQVLLGLKKRGFGEGKWNGFGGKVEKGESIEQAAARELQEECNLVSDKLERVGLLDFEFQDDPVVLEVHVFKTDTYNGDVKESEEMLPKWFSSKAIPYSKMWLDDTYWFPIMLEGSKFYGYFLYQGHSRILRHRVQQLDQVQCHFKEFRNGHGEL